MRSLPLALALALTLGAQPVRAERACYLTFDTVMTMVRTAELDTCPGLQIRPDQGVCRIGLAGHEVLIYVFRRVDDELCLAQVVRYPVDDFMTRFGTSYLKR